MYRIVVLLALACALSPTIAPKVRVDYDHGWPFSRYKTYSWVRVPEDQLAAEQLLGAQFPNQLMQERIVAFIEEALAARHLTRVAKGGDLLVGYHVLVIEQPQITTYSDGWGWGGGFATTTTQTILIGKLVIDIVDPRQRQLLFQGVSTETISSKPEKNTKRLRKAVHEIFEKYPA
jgi:hypothetical protein